MGAEGVVSDKRQKRAINFKISLFNLFLSNYLEHYFMLK